jgi:hypothetical protein
LVVREIFEVLYSPVKAFRKIIEKPDLKGVLLVLALVIASTVVVQYVAYSKFFIENRVPENDNWTELLANQHNWLSNGSPSIDGSDYKMGNADGNHSVASSIPKEESIWLKLTGLDSINSSEETGYKELFFWIKWSREDGLSPNLGTLKLFSGSEDSYFSKDITSFLESSGVWTSATLNIGPDQDWTSNNSPDWQSITGLEFSMNWSSSADLTMKIDGLFFRKFVSPIYTGEFTSLILLPVILQGMLTFAINWVLWSGILIIVGRIFHEDLGKWNVFFVIMGYAFIATFVCTLVSVAPLSTLPQLDVPLDAEAFNVLLLEAWVPLLAYQLWVYLTGIPLIAWIWVAALGAVVVRLMREVTWGKAATIAAVAFGIRVLLNLFLGF